MKIFHLSDLHIGLKLFNQDLYEDQAYIFREICAAAREEQPDVVLIAGDIYDKAIPAAEAVTVFDDFIDQLTEAVPAADLMLISGNHDSGRRLDVFRSVLERQHVYMIGLPPQKPEDFIARVTRYDAHGPVHFYLLPFVKPSMVRNVIGTKEDDSSFGYDETVRRLLRREDICTEERNVLVSHQFYLPCGADADSVERMDSEIRTVGDIDEIRADVLEPFDYAALGHIHKPMRVGRNEYRYCGTPLACSVSEAGQQKGILVIDMEEKGNLSVRTLPLVPLRNVRILTGTLDEILKQGCDDYVTVLLTDTVDADVLDMQDRLRRAFPHLLEIRRQTSGGGTVDLADLPEAEPDVLDLCRAFLSGPEGELAEEEEKILRDIINSVQEEQR